MLLLSHHKYRNTMIWWTKPHILFLFDIICQSRSVAIYRPHICGKCLSMLISTTLWNKNQVYANRQNSCLSTFVQIWDIKPRSAYSPPVSTTSSSIVHQQMAHTLAMVPPNIGRLLFYIINVTMTTVQRNWSDLWYVFYIFQYEPISLKIQC